MHPRLLAFGAGALAVAACLKRRPGLAVFFVVTAAALHPTTAIWFGVWVGVALGVSDRRLRLPAIGAGLLMVAASVWAIVAGPLAGRFVPMDDTWLSVLGRRTYLFPTDWPASAWLLAVLYPAVIAWVYWLRRRQLAVPGPASNATVGHPAKMPDGRARVSHAWLVDSESGLVAGAGVLFALFLASLPFTAMHLAMAVQLQVGRVLWMLDLLAVSYLVWYLAEGAPWARRAASRGGNRAARAVALVLVAVSLARGAYVTFVEHAGRPPVQVGLPANEWNEAMTWIQAHTSKDAWVLASPAHAWKYGTSVRVAAHRDVYLEEAKDTAIGMYSRDAALVVLDRIRRAGDVDALTAPQARALAAPIGLDIVVTEQRLDLPLLYSNRRFAVYRLR
jgi:hypothetical protein